MKAIVTTVLVSLLLVGAASAQTSIDIENYSFEEPGAEKQTNFDDVPGWSTDVQAEDSGVEEFGSSTDGSWIAYLRSDDPGVWQLTDYVLQAGDSVTVKADAENTYQATDFEVALFYDDNGARDTVAVDTFTLGDAWTEYTLGFSTDDMPGAVGNQVGVAFHNITVPTNDEDSWMKLDNVRLEVGESGGGGGGDTEVIASWDFEDQELGVWWTGGGADTVYVTDEQAYEGTYSLAVVADTERPDTLFHVTSNLQDLGVQAGDVVRFHVYIPEDAPVDEGLLSFAMNVNWGDWQQVMFPAEELTLGAWNELDFPLEEMTAEYGQIGLRIFTADASSEATIYVDEVSLLRGDTGTAADGAAQAQRFVLDQNYPNPFRASTKITYELDAPSHVTLAVYNVLGQRVATLVDGVQAAGRQEAALDARGLASGVYLYRIEAGGNVQTRRMMLVR